MLFALLLQTAPATVPDIQLRARVTAKSVTIEKKGEASVRVWASPDGGSLVDVRAPRAGGRKTLRNVTITVDAKASIAGRSAQLSGQAQQGDPQ